LSVTVTCDAGTTASVSVSLAQSSGKRLVSASGSSGVPPGGSLIVCTGAPQLLTIRAVLPAGATTPLKPGPAEMTATVFQSDPANPFGSLTATAGPQEVRLRK
jgi:hypothetical protein